MGGLKSYIAVSIYFIPQLSWLNLKCLISIQNKLLGQHSTIFIRQNVQKKYFLYQNMK